MKKIYETFEEIAEDFVDGDHWTHRLSDHTNNECFAWQHGVAEFAKFLDAFGVEMISNPEVYEKLWNELRTHKPEAETFDSCCKVANPK